MPKQHIKYEKCENDLSNSDIDNECEFEENNVNEKEEEKRTNIIKVEINKIVSKMDSLYNNYMNSKF